MGSSRDRSRSRDRDRRRSRSRDRSRRYERRSRSRSRGRDRDRSRDYRRSSRSRSKTRSRSREREREREREKKLAYDASISAVQAMAALQQQQQLQRQLLAQQLLLQQQAAAAAAAITPAPQAAAAVSTSAATADRKSREIYGASAFRIYVGNLAIGVVNADMLKELFNTILANQVPDPVNAPPVVNVNLDTSGRFAFVEFRTRELTDAAIQLDKLELCGRQMNIGRPKGYVDPGPQLANAAKLGQAQVLAAALAGQVPAAPGTLAAAAATLTVSNPTNVVLLENMVSCGTIRDEQEKKEIMDDVQTEVVKCGPVLGLAVPPPPAHITNQEGCRVYVKYASAAEAQRCRTMMDGRKFDDNQVKAVFVTEGEFLRAQAGEWVATPGLLMPAGLTAALPGPPPLPPGATALPTLAAIPGLAAAAPAVAAAPAAAGLVLPPGFTLPAGFSLAGLGLPK